MTTTGQLRHDAPEQALAEVTGLIGPVAQVADLPPVAAARDVATAWAEDAEAIDTVGVSRARIDQAAHAGLLSLGAPSRFGGGGQPPAVARAVTELLAGACGTTWFVTAQHALPLSVLARAADDVAVRLLPPLCDGTLLAATAVSHLRRPGPAAVRAVPDGDGWRIDGNVGWLTGWGLADVLLLCARTDDDRLVMALLPAREAPGLQAGGPMRLAALQGARTTTAELAGLRVGPEQVVDVLPAAPWLALDTARTANVVPAVFGLLATVCRGLLRAGGRPGEGAATSMALRVAAHGSRLRQQAYALIDEVPAHEQVQERLRLRAESLHLLSSAAAAYVAAGAGASMALSHPAQRLAREAMFHLVQAQTAPVRAAMLDVWAERLPTT